MNGLKNTSKIDTYQYGSVDGGGKEPSDPAMKKKGYGVIGLMLTLLALASFFAGHYFSPVASSGASVALVSSQTQAFTRGAAVSGDPDPGRQWVLEQIKEGGITLEPGTMHGEGEVGAQGLGGCVVGGLGMKFACGAASLCVSICMGSVFDLGMSCATCVGFNGFLGSWCPALISYAREQCYPLVYPDYKGFNQRKGLCGPWSDPVKRLKEVYFPKGNEKEAEPEKCHERCLLTKGCTMYSIAQPPPEGWRFHGEQKNSVCVLCTLFADVDSDRDHSITWDIRKRE